MSKSNITTYRKRGNIVIDGELINSEHPVNAAFIEKRKAKGKWNEGPLAPKKKPLEVPAADLASLPGNFDDSTPPTEEEDFNINADDFNAMDPSELPNNPNQLDIHWKRAKILRERELVQIERMKKEKMQGETIPTTLVDALITQHFKNMSKSMLDSVTSYSSIVIKQLGGTKEDKAELVKVFESIVNEGIHKATELTRADLSSIVDEYKTTRTRGQRK